MCRGSRPTAARDGNKGCRSTTDDGSPETHLAECSEKTVNRDSFGTMTYSRCCAWIIGLAVLAGSGVASAEQEGPEKGTFGLGLIIGEPTGIAAKLYLSNDTAIAAAVGLAIVGDGIHASADYLWHPWILTGQDDPESKFVMPAYLGAGGRVLDHDRGRGADEDFHFGVRAVAGIMFDFKEIPLDVFVEVAGVVDYVVSSADEAHGGIGFDVNAGAGVRYYF